VDTNISASLGAHEWTNLLERVLLVKRLCLYLQHGRVSPSFNCAVRMYRFPGRWTGRGGPQHWPPTYPHLKTLKTSVLGDKWKMPCTSVKIRDALFCGIFSNVTGVQDSSTQQTWTMHLIHRHDWVINKGVFNILCKSSNKILWNTWLLLLFSNSSKENLAPL